ncbi:hypothetical protein LT493_32015 [Streptomyces tricolor]|nr:hypothetical protein [Streptomyces tricolor]
MPAPPPTSSAWSSGESDPGCRRRPAHRPGVGAPGCSENPSLQHGGAPYPAAGRALRAAPRRLRRSPIVADDLQWLDRQRRTLRLAAKVLEAPGPQLLCAVAHGGPGEPGVRPPSRLPSTLAVRLGASPAPRSPSCSTTAARRRPMPLPGHRDPPHQRRQPAVRPGTGPRPRLQQPTPPRPGAPPCRCRPRCAPGPQPAYGRALGGGPPLPLLVASAGARQHPQGPAARAWPGKIEDQELRAVGVNSGCCHRARPARRSRAFVTRAVPAEPADERQGRARASRVHRRLPTR